MRWWSRTGWVALIVLAVGAAGCARSTNGGDDTAARIVDQFLAARQDHNLEATMACFGDSPQLRSSLGVGWSGRDAVRAIMAYRLTDAYTVGDRRVFGNHVTWSEHVRRTVAGAAAPANFDEDVEAVIVGGRIGSLETYVAGARPTSVTEAPAPFSFNPDLLLPFSILSLVTIAVLVWPRAERFQARRVATGHLLAGLREYVERRG